MKERASFASLTKFGLMLGITLVIISLLRVVVGDNIHRVVSVLFSLLSLAAYVFFVYRAIKKSRETIYFDNYKMGKGVLVGLYTGVVAAVLSLFYTYLDVTFIRPERYEALFQQQLVMMGDVIGGDVEAYYGMIETMNHPMMLAFGSFFSTLLGTLVISLFVAPFFKASPLADVEDEIIENKD